MYKKLFRSLFIIIPLVIALWFTVRYSKTDNTFYGDAQGYYMYLPSTFIYHNHTNLYILPEGKGIPSSVMWYVSQMQQNAQRTPKGYVLNQYTYGVALMEAPFYFAAHAYEKWKGLSANGYSLTYEYFIKTAGIVYCLLGLFIIYYVLKRYFTVTQSLIALLFIFIGTNLFWFTTYQAGMAHVPLFFLYASLILLTIKLHERPTYYRFMLCGLVAGIITLIRPTDIVCLLIPLLYNVHSKETWIIKKGFLTKHRKGILLAAICFILPIIPQLLYWHMMTGSYIVYSYGSQGFTWSKPHIIEGLFYFSNGWLPYSPVMLFSLAGLLFYKKMRNWAWATWALLPIYTYIIYSWYCFTYINGLGSRPMIHLYPLLSIPLAAFIAYISNKHFVIKTAFGIISLFFIALNISYSMQKASGVLPSEESNFAYNYQMLFRTKLYYDDLVVMDTGEKQPDPKKLKKIATLACQQYEDSLSAHYVTDTTHKSHYVYHVTNEEYAPGNVEVQYNKKDFADTKWLKCSGRFMIPEGPKDYFTHLLVASVKHKDEYIKWRGMRILNKIGYADTSCTHTVFSLNHRELRKWGYVCFYIKLPSGIQEGDKINLGIWNIAKEEIYLDDICIELYTEI